ncbi:MAG: GGDEF domain-containing protein [Ruminococcus sp.]|nr:GGDEF domain-containing protein [Ruminococcus sp.]
MSRKLIGFIVANPEAVYQQRIMDGLFAQCEKYGYNVAVFSPLVQMCHFSRSYLDGELNIFELMNFDKLDGVITSPITLSEDRVEWVMEKITEKLEKECSKPVIALDLPMGNYDVVYTDDRSAFSVITEHILDVHNCKKVYCLTGMEGYAVAMQRLAGFTDVFEKRGIKIPKEYIFYGDFWYTSGEALAEKIASGEVEMPDAVVCGSDHMAIGLANRLIERGIKVPEQVIVTGYDSTQESIINDPTVTSYIPDIGRAAAEAVDKIRKIIDPNAELIPWDRSRSSSLCIGKSCGCPENLEYIKKRLHSSLYNVNHNYSQKDILNTSDIGRLLEGYVFENFTASVSADDCLSKICRSTYLIRPYSHFYMCLNEEWLNTDSSITKGFSKRMREVMHCVPNDHSEPVFCSDGGDHMFDTELMLPELYEKTEKPSVFYFVALHFNDNSLGYAVLQCDLSQDQKISYVFHNWIRNVNNALEMTRVQNKLMMFSLRDAMTGLYNRRGMEYTVGKMLQGAGTKDSWMIFVIDMDGLKYINDTFGHSEGDYGINAIASVSRRMCRNSEICVRAGGDEFYIIGVGDYNLIDAIVRIEKFNLTLAEINKEENKPYEISASIGYCCEKINSGVSCDEAIRIADGRMYESKIARKKQRQ